MTNKEILDARNEQIERITQTLARKQVSPTDMLQARVDSNNSCRYLFYYYAGTNLDFSKNLDTSNVTDMSNMFYYCSELTGLDFMQFSNFKTNNVTTMSGMFGYCRGLTSLDLSSFNTENVTSMSSMFYNCSSLTSLDLSKFNTSNVTNMDSMFQNCKKFTTLDLSNFDTSKVERMGNMFQYCSGLMSLDLSNWNTSKVTSTAAMFKGCNYLISITGNLDLFSNTNPSYMFTNCISLENVTLKNIKQSITLGAIREYGTKLSNATLINTIKELWDLTGSTSKTLTLSTTSKENIANIYVKLVDVTDEMLAQDPNAANKKPCVVCESTDEGAMTITEYATTQKNWAIA